ncbi:MAG: hypothetical protein AABY22_26495, partial [Nanoarchaeota archaeon]
MSDNETSVEAPGEKPKGVALALKPGILVYLRSEIEGGVKYDSKGLTDEQAEAAGLEVATNVTDTATIRKVGSVIVTDDPDEFDRAKRVRGICRRLVSVLCEETPFGLLCPRDKKDDLAAAIRQSYREAEEFNKDSRYSSVRLWITRGYQVVDDAGDIKRVAEEMREILDEMKAGIDGADAEAVRAAMKRAKLVAGMIDGEHAERVKGAIRQAKEMADQIAKAARDRADKGVEIIVRCKTDEILSARASFLDVVESIGAIEAIYVGSQAGSLDVSRQNAASSALSAAASMLHAQVAKGTMDANNAIKVFDYVRAIARLDLPLSDLTQAETIKAIRDNADSNETLRSL